MYKRLLSIPAVVILTTGRKNAYAGNKTIERYTFQSADKINWNTIIATSGKHQPADVGVFFNHAFARALINKLIVLSLITLFSAGHVFAQAPVISSFNPATGPVGTSVTITGTGFAVAATNNVVFFGATMANVTAASTTSLTVTVPVGTTYMPISVLNSNSALIGNSAKPFITTFMPSKGAITKDDFMPRVAFNTGGGCAEIAIGDLDGDGKADIVMANYNNNTISVLRNTATNGSITTGSFAPKVDFPVGLTPGSIAIADLDGDGKLDLAVANANGSSISVLRNRSTTGSINASSFAPEVDFADPNGPRSIAISDMDGDGKPDIAVSNGNGAAVSIWRNTSTPGSITAGSFDARVDLPVDNSPDNGSIVFDDLDGDGKPDLVFTNAQDYKVNVLRNTATSGLINGNSFAAPVNFAASNISSSVTIGDLDGDGKPDLVESNGNKLYVLRNTSISGSITAGSFAAPIEFAAGNYPGEVKIGDLDGDGKADMVVINSADNAISVLRNTSVSGTITTGSFAAPSKFATGNFSNYVAIGDLDGDGKPDVAVTNDAPSLTSGTVSILRNNPLFPPNAQAANTIFTNTATNTTTASWTNGNGTARAVFIALASTGGPSPAGGTTYTANPAYHSGTQIGSSGWYCVYNGTGNTVNLTGLSSGATYRVMVVEYTGTPGAENYLTTAAAGNPANVTTVAGGPIAINSINLVTSSPTNAGAVQYKATFVTAVTGITASNFALAVTGSLSGAGITSVSGSGTTYTITVHTGSGEGTIGLNLANATGLTPRVISPLPFVGQTYTIDRTAPTITIGSPSVSTIISGAGSVIYGISYVDTNFYSSALSVSNITLNHTGTATGTISVSGSGIAHTVTVSNINGSGSLGISIVAGTASDLAGNTTKAAGPSVPFLVSPVLTNLAVSSGTLAPAFAGTVTAYTVGVSNATSIITVTPTTTDPNATVTVNGGSPSTPVNLVVGFNNITVEVTTLDGSSTTVYTIGVGRAAPAIFGQAPNIAYGTGRITIPNALPFSVTPTNTGGAVPPTFYGQVTIFAGSPDETAGYINDKGIAAQFNVPQQMVSDASGNLYVADSFNQSIRKISPSGDVTTFAGSLQEIADFVDGMGTSARFNFPEGIAIDATGNLFVSDYNNNAIRKITPLGEVSTFYTAPGTFGPAGLCFDASGNLIVAGQDISQIIKISPGGQTTILAGSTLGYSNGPAASAQFNTPTDVKVDSAGNIYVADVQNNAIRKITPAGIVSTIAGSDVNGNTPGYADGVGNAAIFNNPPGLVLAPGGVIYVADFNNNDIRRIMPDGTVSLVAGSAGQVPGDADGIGTAAGLNTPLYMHIDGSGMGYISEFGGERIRKLVLTGYTLKGRLPAGLAFNPTTGIISGTPAIPFTSTTDTVTAFNAFGYSSKIITISYQPPSTIATLSNLDPSAGSLNPAFVAITTSYADAVSNATTNITLTPTATDSAATVTVNGKTVVSGTASASIPLSVGANVITTVVTAQDGIATETYTVTVNRAALSTIATLNDLAISSGTLTPVFATGTMNYLANVPNAINSVTLTPTNSDVNATVRVNGIPVTSGTASLGMPLAAGPNTITTVITAEDGTTTATYTIIVTRAPSTDAILSDLIISSGTLTPAFASGTVTYSASVSNATTAISVTPVTNDASATATVNGIAVPSGTASAPIPLNIGSNAITAVVTAQDGTTTHTYTVVVTRLPSLVATLADLKISQGTLTPAFNPATSTYTASLPNSVSGITETPTFTDPNATITVNGSLVTSGSASGNIPLAVGPNTITTVVTAQDGTTTDTYTVVVTRAASSVASLANLSISQGTLTPAFDPSTSTYTASVANSVTGITETPTFTDANATITVNGKTVASGSPSGNIPLAVGPNTITTLVTAQDGTTSETYTVIVTRAPSSVTTLTDITVSEGKLTPSFSSGTLTFADSVSTDITSIKVTATVSDPAATILVNGKPVNSGTASEAIPLAPGNNTITVMITAQDGTTTDTYTITVYRGKPLTTIDATNVLTPNGDGKNDYWTIKDIGLYPNNTVNIFDKAGRLVYSKRGYSNDWDGTFNGAPLAEGTYYYVVDLGPDLPKFKGYISILRN